MRYESTKTYGHEQGLSCAFRQWRADSHCHFLHGYALAFRFVFGADELDDKGWVVDFGGLKELKEMLKTTFDHKTAVAADDPEIERFKRMAVMHIMQIEIFQYGVGVERFAETAWWQAWGVVQAMNRAEGGKRLKVISCECMEHAGNSAIYYGPNE